MNACTRFESFFQRSSKKFIDFAVLQKAEGHLTPEHNFSAFGTAAMLCEGRLLKMIYGEPEELDSHPPQKTFHGRPSSGSPFLPSVRRAPLVHHDSPERAVKSGDRSASVELYISPLQSSDEQAAHTGRQMSPGIEIPAQSPSGGDTPFLVPSFCQSFCKNYSDLHIGGDQVLPLTAAAGELRVCADAQAAGPFLQSFDVPSAVEESLVGQASQGGLRCPPKGGLNRRRQGSFRDRSLWLQGREGPFSNSLLNHYLEQKILDLYQQHMMDNMAREGAPGSDSGVICPLLGSELVLTSLDQITLQLSRDGNLEAGLAKDMVLSCLLRVAGDMQSSEISTPILQISSEASREQLVENKEE